MSELRRVNPRDIKVPEIRVTAQFDEEKYEQFKASIKQVGQIAPPIVYDVDGELVLCDGLHRIQEAIANGDQEIEIAVIPGDMVDVLTKNIFIDHLRGKTPASQMVKVIKILYLEENLDSDKIVEKTGLTREYVERIMKISEASPAVLEALDQDAIGVGIAFELARLPYAIQQEEILAKQQMYRFPVKELRDFITQTLQYMEEEKDQPATAAQPPALVPRVYKCEGCKGETDPRYLRPVQLCPDCFGAVWRLAEAAKATEVKVKEEGVAP